ncbi:hypothetical protein R3W88_018179 [Solanum pinnatisectum]|uniref:Uncharacterized protein n=1 Tax=Solanum pinnatisectum TaxID=50273 RepID=A0AAV9L2J7_9SOLN|nr:hypothetical protein R3W88_018179 [Solanum pinnatisectum]
MSDPQILNQVFPKGHHEEEILILNKNNSSSTSRHNIGEDLCRTPTCRKNKIPIVGSCPPPAPKKPRKLLLSKKKFSQFEFFEVGGNEELEKFFISCNEISRGMAVKKRLLMN